MATNGTHRALRVGVGAAALVAGAIVSVLAVSATSARSAGESDPAWTTVDASEVLPGAPVVTLLGARVTESLEGSSTVTLDHPPAEATHIRIAVTCLTAGTIGWGFDPANTPSMSCVASDVPDTGWEDVPLTGSTVLHVLAADSVSLRLEYQYANHRPTDVATNAAGETFGVGGAESPDLVAVIGRDDAGNLVEGYARSSELDVAGLPQPQNPDEAAEYMEQIAELAEQYPEGYPVPVYESDGVTRIGTFYVSL